MAWFLNFYKCDRCKRRWTDEWSCMCDDECPHCGARDMTPVDSHDLTELIEQDGDKFIALRSPSSAEHVPTIASLVAFRPARRPRNVSLRSKNNSSVIPEAAWAAVRIPFSRSRLQPSVNEGLEPTEFQRAGFGNPERLFQPRGSGPPGLS
jgi:hypothetical protein